MVGVQTVLHQALVAYLPQAAVAAVLRVIMETMVALAVAVEVVKKHRAVQVIKAATPLPRAQTAVRVVLQAKSVFKTMVAAVAAVVLAVVAVLEAALPVVMEMAVPLGLMETDIAQVAVVVAVLVVLVDQVVLHTALVAGVQELPVTIKAPMQMLIQVLVVVVALLVLVATQMVVTAVPVRLLFATPTPMLRLSQQVLQLLQLQAVSAHTVLRVQAQLHSEVNHGSSKYYCANHNQR